MPPYESIVCKWVSDLESISLSGDGSDPVVRKFFCRLCGFSCCSCFGPPEIRATTHIVVDCRPSVARRKRLSMFLSMMAIAVLVDVEWESASFNIL